MRASKEGVTSRNLACIAGKKRLIATKNIRAPEENACTAGQSKREKKKTSHATCTAFSHIS